MTPEDYDPFFSIFVFIVAVLLIPIIGIASLFVKDEEGEVLYRREDDARQSF